MNRYTKLYSLKKYGYCNNCPLIIEAGHLLKDSLSGNIIAQIKLLSISQSRIISVKIELKELDISGEIIGKTYYDYLDLSVNRGESFGHDKAIELGDRKTRQIKVKCVEVVFENLTKWKDEENTEWYNFDLPISIEYDFQDSELANQYKLDIGDFAQYKPVKYDNIWQCTCGQFNCGEVCSNCKKTQKIIFGLYSKEELDREKNKRLETEKLKKEEIRLKKEKRHKTINRIVLWCIAICIASIGGRIAWNKVLVPYINYSKAQNLLKEQKFEEALALFQNDLEYKDTKEQLSDIRHQYVDYLLSIGNTKKANEVTEKNKEFGSEDYLVEKEKIAKAYVNNGEIDEAILALKELEDTDEKKEIMYKVAEDLYNSGDYSGAKKLFALISYYKNSKEMLQNCLYNEGKKYIDNQQYEQAVEVFTKGLGYYSNSKDLLNYCYYQIGCARLKEEKYDNARIWFRQINDREQYNEKVKDSLFQYGTRKYEIGDYKEAEIVFSNLGEYKDSKDREKECNYEYACELMNQNKYEEAETIFKKLNNYKLSNENITECAYCLCKNLINEGKYEGAAWKLKELNNYKDSFELINKCYYQMGLENIEKYNFEKAKENLLLDNDYSNTKKLLELLSTTKDFFMQREDDLKTYYLWVHTVIDPVKLTSNLLLSEVQDCGKTGKNVFLSFTRKEYEQQGNKYTFIFEDDNPPKTKAYLIMDVSGDWNSAIQDTWTQGQLLSPEGTFKYSWKKIENTYLTKRIRNEIIKNHSSRYLWEE